MAAWNVAQFSLKTTTSIPVTVHRLALSPLQSQGLYYRPTLVISKSPNGQGRLYDEISQHKMTTGHAIARFLVPKLMNYQGWALFVDGDVLFRADVAKLFSLANSRYAVQVVKHQYEPKNDVKKGGHVQTTYFRKNWSSVMLFNCEHPANQALTVELVNSVPGRDLHRFCWLEDDLIGGLPETWNHLVGHSTHDDNPSLVHFTEGLPDVQGYENQPFASEWFDMARACGYKDHAVGVRV